MNLVVDKVVVVEALRPYTTIRRCSLLYEQMNIHKVRDCLDDFELQMEFVCDGSLKLLIKLHDFSLLVNFELVKGIFTVRLLFYECF